MNVEEGRSCGEVEGGGEFEIPRVKDFDDGIRDGTPIQRAPTDAVYPVAAGFNRLHATLMRLDNVFGCRVSLRGRAQVVCAEETVRGS